MTSRSLQCAADERILASGDDFALLSAFVPGLPNTVLVQLLRDRHGELPAFSLYAVYRESGMTFDAIVGFDIVGPRSPLEDVLMEFVKGAEFEEALLRPLTASVRRHFRREAVRPS